MSDPCGTGVQVLNAMGVNLKRNIRFDYYNKPEFSNHWFLGFVGNVKVLQPLDIANDILECYK